MNGIGCPQTPPRRSARGSILTPSCAPHVHVTPSKTPSRSAAAALRVPRTPLSRTAAASASVAGPSRLLLSTPQHRRHPHRTPIAAAAAAPPPSAGGGHPQYGASPSAAAAGEAADDRFIPSRRQTHLDLCRRALLSGEKRPRPGAGAGAAPDPAAANPSSSPSPSASASASRHGTSETPLQKEFKRRMLSSLCNVPLAKLDEDGEPTGLLSFRSHSGSGPAFRGGSGRSVSVSVSVSSGSAASSHSSSSASAATTAASAIRPQPLQPHYSYGHPRLPLQHATATAATAASNPFSHDLLRTMKLGENVVLGHDAASAAEDLSVAKKVLRKVPSAPFRILDAPDIVDDYYLNLISWSKDNVLAVALAQSVYLWNASTGEIHHLVTLENPTDYVTSVNWCTMPGSTKWIAVGTNSCAVHLFDAHALQKIRTFVGHAGRVSSLAWNQHWITSGSRDAAIHNHDVRVGETGGGGTAVVAKYRGHQQEVCGLKWNDDGTTLASGGNENYLCLWDAAMSGRDRGGAANGVGAIGASLSDAAPRLVLKKHRAAVKALDWCPFHRGLLASGGGTSDRTIKFWSSNSGALLNSVDTGSQVCSIVWSRHHRELCSSHGYSENQLILWKYPTMARVKELPGHTARVLNMEPSPDGASVVSAAADETLRFWNVFGSPSSHRKPSSLLAGDIGSFGTPTIR